MRAAANSRVPRASPMPERECLKRKKALATNDMKNRNVGMSYPEEPIVSIQQPESISGIIFGSL